MKTLNLAQQNKDKTNFLLVYREGLAHSVEAVFHAERVCEQQQMASSEGKQALTQKCTVSPTTLTGVEYSFQTP